MCERERETQTDRLTEMAEGVGGRNFQVPFSPGLPFNTYTLPSPFSSSLSYLPAVLVPSPLAGPVWTPCLTLNYHSVLLGVASARESRVLAEAALKILHYESWACSLQRVKQANKKG